MPILNPIVLPTVGMPEEAVAQPKQRRTMVNPALYTQNKMRQQDIMRILPTMGSPAPQKKNSTVTKTNADNEPEFDQPAATGDYLQEMFSKIQGRAAPPALDPGARVKPANMDIVNPSNFQKFYENLSLIDDIGQQQTAAAQSRAAFQKQAALRNVGSSSSGEGGGDSSPTGQLKYSGGGSTMGWIQEAANILKGAGISLSPQDMQWVGIMIQHESGGNPNAINLWDSNAKAGIPSKGLMQTIDPTFNSNKLPGYNDIYNPVHNILAGVRYAIRRYGSIANVPGIRNLNSGRGYVGY